MPQSRHLPSSSIQPTIGMLSRQRIGCLHRGQCDGGHSRLRRRGRRWTTTLAKLPNSDPSTNSQPSNRAAPQGVSANWMDRRPAARAWTACKHLTRPDPARYRRLVPTVPRTRRHKSTGRVAATAVLSRLGACNPTRCRCLLHYVIRPPAHWPGQRFFCPIAAKSVRYVRSRRHAGQPCR